MAIQELRASAALAYTRCTRISAANPCCLFAVIPPSLRNAAAVARFRRRAAKNVPIRHPVRGLVPLRNPVASGADDAVEGAASGNKVRSVFRGNDSLDQLVNDGIGDARQILRALDGGRL